MNKKGFTLTELMITVAIIGILAAISTVVYTGYQQRARRSTAFGLVQTVALTEEKRFAERGAYATLATIYTTYGLQSLGTLSGSDVLTTDWRIQVTQPGAGQFFARAIPLDTSKSGTLRPCMRSDGVQGYNPSGGNAWADCVQGDWK